MLLIYDCAAAFVAALVRARLTSGRRRIIASADVQLKVPVVNLVQRPFAEA